MKDTLIDLNGRVRDRAREVRQRRLRLLRRVLIGVVLAGVVGWVALASPLFTAQQIVVTGNERVSTETILAAAEVPVGTPLAQVNTSAVAARVSDIPGVGRGEVTRQLPDTIAISVVERTVSFTVAVEGGYAWIDPSGQVFHQSVEAPPGIPLGEVDLGDAALLSDLATVVSSLPAELRARVRVVTAKTQDSVVIMTTDEVKIVWGSSDSSLLKGQVASALAQAMPTARTIDVSSPTHPTTR